jgi:phosphoribosylformylglycinamidine synthase subunit PurL
VVREAVRAGRVSSAHDVSDGGLACAIAECAIGGGIGCRIDLSALIERGASAEEALFGEGRGGFIVAGDRAELESLAVDSVPMIVIGETGGDTISIAAADAELTVSVENAAQAWSSLSERLG